MMVNPQLSPNNTLFPLDAFHDKILSILFFKSYAVHGSFTKTTGPNAPIRAQCADPENQLSVESAIEVYLKQGFRPEQLSLGIPGYAKSWTLTNPELTPRIVGNYTSYYYQNYTGIPVSISILNELRWTFMISLPYLFSHSSCRPEANSMTNLG
jgi:GH18 family chitinase